MLNNAIESTNKIPESDKAVQVMDTLFNLHEKYQDALARLLKPRGISPLQFQVLRIVRSHGEEGIPSLGIKQQVAHRVMDVTRVVDRLENQGFVRRDRPAHDRRVVLVRLTPEGSEVMERLDQPFSQLNSRILKDLDTSDLDQLAEILGRV